MKSAEDSKLFFQYYSCRDKSAATKNLVKTCEALDSFFNVSIIGTLSEPKSIFEFYNSEKEPAFFRASLGVNGSILLQLPDRLIFILYSYLHVLKKDIDVLYSRDILFMIFLSLPFVSRDYKLIYESHDKFSRRIFMPKILEKRGLIEADRILTVSKGLKKEFESMGIHKDNISIQRNCVDLENYKTVQSPENNKKVVLTYIGSFTDRKDVETLIKSYKTLSNTYEQKFKLNLIGKNMEWVENSVKDIKNVDYTGYLSSKELRSYFEQTNIFIMTSRDNDHQRKYTSPMKLFEYMASGRPVIAADLPSIRQIGENNIFYYKAEDSGDLTDKIDYVVKNYERALNKAEEAFETVKKNYTWSKKAENIKEVVGEI